MVVILLPLCLAKGDIKQINADSTIPSEEDVRFAGNLSQISVCSHCEPLVLKIGKPLMVMVRNFQRPSPFHRRHSLILS